MGVCYIKTKKVLIFLKERQGYHKSLKEFNARWVKIRKKSYFIKGIKILFIKGFNYSRKKRRSCYLLLAVFTGNKRIVWIAQLNIWRDYKKNGDDFAQRKDCGDFNKPIRRR